MSKSAERGARTEVVLSLGDGAPSSARDQGRPESPTPFGSPAHAGHERLAYTVEEAALILGVGRDLLYDEIRTGRLRSKKAGARRVIARHHLLEWLDSDRPEPSRRAG